MTISTAVHKKIPPSIFFMPSLTTIKAADPACFSRIYVIPGSFRSFGLPAEIKFFNLVLRYARRFSRRRIGPPARAAFVRDGVGTGRKLFQSRSDSCHITRAQKLE